jgi:hypothetical protein
MRRALFRRSTYCCFLLVVMGIAATACGNAADGDRGGGEGGSGGASTSAGSGEEAGACTLASFELTSTAPGCPADPPFDPLWGTQCEQVGLECVYTSADVVFTFTCTDFTSLDEDINCVEVPHGFQWSSSDTSDTDGCSGGNGCCVRCFDAYEGDPCDVVDYSCEHMLGGGNCDGMLICSKEGFWVYYQEIA